MDLALSDRCAAVTSGACRSATGGPLPPRRRRRRAGCRHVAGARNGTAERSSPAGPATGDLTPRALPAVANHGQVLSIELDRARAVGDADAAPQPLEGRGAVSGVAARPLPRPARCAASRRRASSSASACVQGITAHPVAPGADAQRQVEALHRAGRRGGRQVDIRRDGRVQRHEGSQGIGQQQVSELAGMDTRSRLLGAA